MAFELREGQMFIFSNKDKTKDNQPTHKGQTKIDGKEYWVSCWTKEGKNGRFFSCSLQEKDEAPATNVPTSNMSDGSLDEDIPF